MTVAEFGKNFQERDSFFRHRYAFINATGFRSEKRFARYVSKIKSQADKLLYEKFHNNSGAYQYVADHIRFLTTKHIDLDLNVEKVQEVQEEFFGDAEETDRMNRIEDSKFLMRYQFESMDIDHDLDIMEELENNLPYLHNYAFNDLSAKALWKEIFNTYYFYDMLQKIKGKIFNPPDAEDILRQEESILKNYDMFQWIIETEFAECCWEYLYSRITDEESTLNSENYTIVGLPRGAGEIMRILTNTIDRSVTNMLNGCKLENSITEDIHPLVMQHLDEIETLSKENAELEDEIDHLMGEMATLKKRVDGFETEKKKEFEKIKKNNDTLSYENSKLEKKNAELEAECERLRQVIISMQEETPIVETPVVEEETVEIDCNKRFVFVMDGNPYGEEQIRKTFPNSIIIFENMNLNPNNVDGVLCLTNRVKHCVYDPIKSQCKNKGIPFVHCKQGNIEFIKKALSTIDA